MNISDFRKDLKHQFDLAIQQPVLIERGGLVFELTTKGLTSPAAKISFINKIVTSPTLPPVSDVCKGTHYMNRTNCGKKGCTWK